MKKHIEESRSSVSLIIYLVSGPLSQCHPSLSYLFPEYVQLSPTKIQARLHLMVIVCRLGLAEKMAGHYKVRYCSKVGILIVMTKLMTYAVLFPSLYESMNITNSYCVIFKPSQNYLSFGRNVEIPFTL